MKQRFLKLYFTRHILIKNKQHCIIEIKSDILFCSILSIKFDPLKKKYLRKICCQFYTGIQIQIFEVQFNNN